MLYGAVRPMISKKVMELTSPFLPSSMAIYVDNIGMGLVNYLIAKNTGGMIRQIAIKGLVAENVLLGADLGGKFLNATSGTSANGVNLFDGGNY